jgi:uncharacterized membrane protein HdeD (DUF308 family)
MATTATLPTAGGSDARTLAKRTWWVFLIGGIASAIFGVLAFVQPGIALFVLATLFAAAVLVDGAFNLIGAVRNREKDGWWIMGLIGLLGVGVGAYALFNPPLSMLAFVLVVALEAIVLGVLLFLLGWKIRALTTKEWILYATGILSVIFGLLVVFRPLEGAVSVVFLIASWALVTGALKVWFAFRVRSFPERLAEALGR